MLTSYRDKSIGVSPHEIEQLLLEDSATVFYDNGKISDDDGDSKIYSTIYSSVTFNSSVTDISH